MKWRVLFMWLILLHFSVKGYSQRLSPDYWHFGSIVSKNSDTIRGLVKYDFTSDLIQFDRAGIIKVFTPAQLNYCEFTDSLSGRLRKIVSHNFETSPGYSKPLFFELLVSGKLTLLCRELVVLRSNGNMGSQGFNNSYRDISFSFFYLRNQEVSYFYNKKKRVLSLFGQDKNTVAEFAKKNRYRFYSQYDLTHLFQFYNSLHD